MGLFGPPNVKKLFDRRDVDGLVAVMADRDAQVCQQAMQALVTIGPPAVKPLIVALGDRREPVVRGAMDALAGIGAPAIQPLIESLSCDNPGVRAAASTTLAKMGPLSAKPLVEALFTTYSWYTHKGEGICVALLAIGAPAMVPLIDALKKDNAVLELSKLDKIQSLLRPMGPAAIPYLLRAFTGVGQESHYAIAYILKMLGWQPGNDLDAVCYYRALGEYDDLARIGAPAVQALAQEIEMSKKKSRDLFDQSLKIRPFEPGYESKTKALGEARAYQQKHVLEPAMQALENMKDPLAVEPLVRYGLRSKDEDVRKAAKAAIIRLGWRPESCDDPAVLIGMGQWDKCMALGEKSIGPLLEALKDLAFRDMAAETLGLIAAGNPGRAPDIARELVWMLTYLTRPEYAARYRPGDYICGKSLFPIVRALGRTGEPSCVDVLLPRLDSDGKDTYVQSPLEALELRKEVARALVRLYFRGRLDDARKAMILAAKSKITQPHQVLKSADETPDGYYYPREEHSGIGVEFADPGN